MSREVISGVLCNAEGQPILVCRDRTETLREVLARFNGSHVAITIESHPFRQIAGGKVEVLDEGTRAK